MLNKIILASLLSLWITAATADTVSVNPDHPEQYIVQKGDTLWDIAGRFLQQPWRWPEVWQGNPQISNPHLIYPGDVVTLTFVDGEPVLSVGNVARSVSGRTVRLSPTIRVHERDEAIPAIPIDAIKSFLTRPLVVEKDEMQEWPYIVASYDEHLIASSGNKIYVRGLDDMAAASSKRYAVYRQGKPYKKYSAEGESEEILGYEALYVGDAVIHQGGDPATGVIASADREILVGDRLREQLKDDVNTAFIPRPPVRDVEGNIISVVDGVTQIGQYQVVVLDVGEDDGLETGNVLGIYQSGVVVNDKIAARVKQRKKDEELLNRIEETDYEKDGFGGAIAYLLDQIVLAKHKFDNEFPHFSNLQAKPEEVTLPESNAGVLMVIRTFDRVSYGLVMDVTAPIHINDRVRSM
ncbi:MAG: LysM peptidoglycan-binding domain-containing protein [Gammaproteobacteria bacterium]|nr:LysM peptidoglycan-binding domain-containing protein [Gammaproteobacteria bacterium]